MKDISDLVVMNVMNLSGAALAVAAVIVGITVRVFLFAQPGIRSNWRQFFKPSQPRPSR